MNKSTHLGGLSQNHVITILRRIPLFDGLNDGEYKILTEFCRVRVVKAGETLFREGDFGFEFFVILVGEMTVSTHAKGPINQIVPGDVLGEMAVVRRSSRSATVTADRDALLLRIRRDELDQIVGIAPRVSYLIAMNIARRLSERLVHSNELIPPLEREATAAAEQPEGEHWDYVPISVR